MIELINKRCPWLLNFNLWLCFCLGLYLIAALFNFGIYHWDELFQTIEPAATKLGLSRFDELPWEFSQKVRPWLQIWIYYFLAFLTQSWWIENRFVLGSVCQVFNGIFFALCFSYFLKQIFDFKKHPFFYFLILSFYAGVFFAVRSSSESLSSSFFFWGLGLCLSLMNLPKTWFWVGVLFGLSFQARYQMGIPISFVGLWLLVLKEQRSWKHWLLMALGFVLTQFFGQVLNRLGYGVWILPELNYFVANIVQGVASQFGVSPYYGYVNELSTFLGWPFTLMLGISFIYCCIRYWKEVWIWIALPHLFIHSAIPHKELRFLMPILALIPLYWVVAGLDFSKYLKETFPKSRAQKVFLVLFSAHFVFFSFMGWCNRNLRPVEPKFHLLKAFHRHVDGPLHYVFNDIDPLQHGDHSFKLYGIAGTHLKLDIKEILKQLERREFYLKNLILSYTGPSDSAFLDKYCHTYFKDESNEFWVQLHSNIGSFFSPPPPSSYSIQVLVCDKG